MAGTRNALLGPHLAAAPANIYTPPAATRTPSSGIHVSNETTAPVTFSLYIGATGGASGGTSIAKNLSVPANLTWDYYCVQRMDATDFLSGSAGSAVSLVITVEGEYVVI